MTEQKRFQQCIDCANVASDFIHWFATINGTSIFLGEDNPVYTARIKDAFRKLEADDIPRPDENAYLSFLGVLHTKLYGKAYVSIEDINKAMIQYVNSLLEEGFFTD